MRKKMTVKSAVSFLLLGPGVNFINVLREAFTCQIPESVTFQLSHQCLFTLLGSACIKAARKTLMKLTPTNMNDAQKKVDEIREH
jgi:hypothetical protein